MSTWVDWLGPAQVRVCPACRQLVNVRERREVAEDGTRIVYKDCEHCGQFFSRTVLPPEAT